MSEHTANEKLHDRATESQRWAAVLGKQAPTLHPTFAKLLKPFSPPRSSAHDDPVICLVCNGSGEGYVDGTNCRVCKGLGEVKQGDQS